MGLGFAGLALSGQAEGAGVRGSLLTLVYTLHRRGENCTRVGTASTVHKSLVAPSSLLYHLAGRHYVASRKSMLMS